MRTISIVFLIIFVCEPVYASGMCSCNGIAVVRKRSDVKNYSSMVHFDRPYSAEASDPKRDDFERVVQVSKDGLECQGHSVCTYPEILYFLRIKKSEEPPIMGQILETMYSKDKDLHKVLRPGVKFNFSHQAVTSGSSNHSTWTFGGVVKK